MGKKQIILAIVIGISVMLVTWLFYGYASHVEIPQKIKLTDCTTNNTVKIDLHVPKGNNYYLLVDTPTAYSFSGRVRILEGVTSIEDTSFKGLQVFWGLPNVAYVLTDFRNATNNTAWNQIVKSQKDYNIQIVFDQPPPPATSVWLYWLQTHKDRDR
jgi:hypothetical protein